MPDITSIPGSQNTASAVSTTTTNPTQRNISLPLLDSTSDSNSNSKSSSKPSTSQTSTSTSKNEEKKHPRFRLVSWDDLPHWQRDNHYIISGYVPATSSISGCIQSLTYLHNESVNIYTHLIPSLTVIFSCSFLVFLVLFFSYELSILPSPSSSPTSLDTLSSSSPNLYLLSDNAAFLIFGLGLATCLGLSATFHTLKSHSHAIATFGNKLDYLGIVFLIVSSMISLVNYSFADLIYHRLFFWGLTLFLGSACGVVSLNSKFRTPDWRPFRASMFVAFGLSGVFPVLSGLFIFGLNETSKRSQLFFLLTEAALYIGGAAIYAARIPERYHPGKYDFFGHSHQIFHILVVLAAISHGLALVYASQYAHSVTLPNFYRLLSSSSP